MIIINGTITTESPLSISMPVAKGSRENSYKNFPLLVRGLDDEGEKTYTGYLPATTVRGFLRRAIVMADMKVAAEAENPYKLPQAYAELIGQDAASEQQAGEIDLVALQNAREGSPVLDLFGAGLGIKSRLRVGHFLPEHNVLPDPITGVRKDLDDNEQAFELLDQDDIEEFYARSKANTRRAEAESMLKSLERQWRINKRNNDSLQDLDAKIIEAKKWLQESKDMMGAMTNSSRTILTHFALGAGLDLSGRLVIENPKERDIPMLELALNALSLFPILGAQSARGCGEISGVFDFFKDGSLFKRMAIGGFQAAKVDNF